MKKIIHETLNELGVSFNGVGREYLETAIEMILNRGRMSVSYELYPRIAKIHKTTASRAERAIRNSIENAFLNTDIKVMAKYFGNAISYKNGKISNSNFIYGVVKHIQIYNQECLG